ncbi:hypothetical protein MF672_000915 [Actinomadura sp. ATCC 31491]|uniref:Trypsin-co-occurring domain-containing protein n=1 Tax=Actinomadura luzonensis TaxID=2805427 RepID=A0ABT0FJ92_9ACTN|nr:trypco2 family protein [Actinomadura luzonensis]MCK2212366.1 hypothetical protein [Actinomadura luzonensis]
MAIELAELVGQLRAELTKAMNTAEDAELRFELGPIELELTVGVNKDVNSGGKVRFWVVELGGQGAMSSQSTQRIKLTLDPQRTGQTGKLWIAGGEEPDER